MRTRGCLPETAAFLGQPLKLRAIHGNGKAPDGWPGWHTRDGNVKIPQPVTGVFFTDSQIYAGIILPKRGRLNLANARAFLPPFLEDTAVISIEQRSKTRTIRQSAFFIFVPSLIACSSACAERQTFPESPSIQSNVMGYFGFSFWDVFLRTIPLQKLFMPTEAASSREHLGAIFNKPEEAQVLLQRPFAQKRPQNTASKGVLRALFDL